MKPFKPKLVAQKETRSTVGNLSLPSSKVVTPQQKMTVDATLAALALARTAETKARVAGLTVRIPACSDEVNQLKIWKAVVEESAAQQNGFSSVPMGEAVQSPLIFTPGTTLTPLVSFMSIEVNANQEDKNLIKNKGVLVE